MSEINNQLISQLHFIHMIVTTPNFTYPNNQNGHRYNCLTEHFNNINEVNFYFNHGPPRINTIIAIYNIAYVPILSPESNRRSYKIGLRYAIVNLPPKTQKEPEKEQSIPQRIIINAVEELEI